MINTQETSQITKIYLVTNCFGDPNKVYIGKTKTTQRKYHHQNNFGKGIIYTEIDKVESLDSKDWKPLETFWINYFKFLGFDVQNKNNGGGGLNKINEDHLNKIISSHKKEIIQYNLNGEFIREWSSIIEASIKLDIDKGSISLNCRNKTNSAGGFIWRFKKNNIQLNIKPYSNSLYKPILQYDLEGNFIREWDNLDQPKKELNIKGISYSLNNKCPIAKGFQWKFKTDNYPLKIDSYERNHSKRKLIEQYSLNNELVRVWESLIQIKNELGINPIGCLLGKNKTSKGYFWKYKN